MYQTLRCVIQRGVLLSLWLWGAFCMGMQEPSLKGEWHFEPERLELPTWTERGEGSPLTLPGALRTGEGQAPSFATLWKDQQWQTEAKGLGLKVWAIFGAYQLWLVREEGPPQLLAQSGRVGTKAENTEFQMLEQVVPLPQDLRVGERVRWVLLISSFHIAPIVREVPQIGRWDELLRGHLRAQMERAVLVGGFFMIFLYACCLWWQRPVDRANFWVGCLALTLLFRYLCTEWMLSLWLESPYWNEAYNAVAMTDLTLLATLCVTAILSTLYPWPLLRRIFHLTLGTFGLYFVLHPFLGLSRMMASADRVLLAVILIHTPMLLLSIVYLVKRRAQDVGWIVAGVSGLAFAGINDYGIYFLQWPSIYLTHYATLVFAFSQSLVTGRRFARTFEHNEQLLQEIQEQERARTTFFHNTSHELRTPLNGILGFLRLLLAEHFGVQTEAARTQLGKCIRLAESLTLQVNTILDLAKSRRGTLRLNCQVFRLAELKAEMQDLAEGLQLRRGSSLFTSESSFDEQIVFIGDREKCATILRNLIGNAFKFSDPKRLNQVQLKMSKTSQGLECEVKDTGIGIPPHQVDKIFEEFSQLASDARRRYEGTGLGLALVKDLVQLMGGRIEVQSTLDQGSTFKIWIPESSEHEAQIFQVERESALLPERSSGSELKIPPKKRSLQAGYQLEAAKILVVDDHELNCEVVEHILEQNSYQVISAYGGREALAKARRERPDLILLDVMMPEMSGEDVLLALRQEESLAEIPVILLTARASESDRVHGLSLGADDYLAKPIQAEELLFRVGNLLGRLRLHRRAVRSEEDEKFLQMGRLLQDLSHELKNIFHYSEAADFFGEDQRAVLRFVPLQSESWAKAQECLQADERSLDTGSEAFLSLPTEASPSLAALRLRLSYWAMAAKDKQELWGEIQRLTQDQQRSLESLLKLLQQLRMAQEQLSLARELVSSMRRMHRSSGQEVSDVGQVCRALERLLRARSQRLHVSLKWPQQTELLAIKETALLQILLNLLGNATDYVQNLSREERWVTVGVKSSLEWVELEIANGGPISEVMRRWAAAPASESKTLGDGSGLGLKISKKLVEEAGGSLDCDVQAPHPRLLLRLKRAKSSAEKP